MKVYLICGTTGEYSDKYIWKIGITSSKEEAENFVNFMNKKLANSCELDYDEREKLKDELREYDPNVRIDYTGASYEFEEFDLNEIPKIME